MISIFVVKSSIHWLVGADRGRRTAHGRGGELTAMYRALERALGRPRRPHVIHSDSLYTIHMTTGRGVDG